MSLSGKRVVIIEDEGMSLLAFRRSCEHAGLNVVGTAGNGKEGVQIVLQEQPDIVLMDIRMPVMDGLQATREILRQICVCILLVTAYVGTTDLGEIVQLGAHGYLGKPVSGEQLLSAIKDAYERFLEGKTFGF